MWCGVVWCGVVWCGVVWCGVVFRVRLGSVRRAHPQGVPRGDARRQKSHQERGLVRRLLCYVMFYRADCYSNKLLSIYFSAQVIFLLCSTTLRPFC